MVMSSNVVLHFGQGILRGEWYSLLVLYLEYGRFDYNMGMACINDCG